jgi:hypothetical protein
LDKEEKKGELILVDFQQILTTIRSRQEYLGFPPLNEKIFLIKISKETKN